MGDHLLLLSGPQIGYRTPSLGQNGTRPVGQEVQFRLQYSCLENSMDRGTWWAAVHRVPKSQT